MRLRLSPQSNPPNLYSTRCASAGFNEAAAFAAEQPVDETEVEYQPNGFNEAAAFAAEQHPVRVPLHRPQPEQLQ